MNVRNCRKCGKMFNYITGVPICPSCKEAMEAKFQEVKEYIREHKGAGIQEVSEACDVEVQQITQWLREDRLEVTEGSNIMLNCETCGAPIRSGRFCEVSLPSFFLSPPLSAASPRDHFGTQYRYQRIQSDDKRLQCSQESSRRRCSSR